MVMKYLLIMATIISLTMAVHIKRRILRYNHILKDTEKTEKITLLLKSPVKSNILLCCYFPIFQSFNKYSNIKKNMGVSCNYARKAIFLFIYFVMCFLL